MRHDERDALRRRFRYRCGYCTISEVDAGSQLTVDHFQPRSQGGLHVPENWVYSCHACNEFKGDWWQPREVKRILHPFNDDLSRHFAEQPAGLLQALSETGEFHISRLHLNRPRLVAFRSQREHVESARRSLDRLLGIVADLQAEGRTLARELDELKRGD